MTLIKMMMMIMMEMMICRKKQRNDVKKTGETYLNGAYSSLL